MRLAKCAYAAIAPIVVRHPWKVVLVFVTMLLASCAAVPKVSRSFTAGPTFPFP